MFRENAPFMDDALETTGIKDLYVGLDCCWHSPIEISGYALRSDRGRNSEKKHKMAEKDTMNEDAPSLRKLLHGLKPIYSKLFLTDFPIISNMLPMVKWTKEMILSNQPDDVTFG